jgi:hypothetical protein
LASGPSAGTLTCLIFKGLPRFLRVLAAQQRRIKIETSPAKNRGQGMANAHFLSQ